MKKIILFISIFSAFFVNAQYSTQVFDTAGNYSWTCPTEIISINVQVFGGGGGGSGSSLPSRKGGGGSGGSYAASERVPVTPGITYTIVVGAGGVGGPFYTNSVFLLGGTGGFSSFSDGSTVLLKANGGIGGTHYSTSGKGGTAINENIISPICTNPKS